MRNWPKQTQDAYLVFLTWPCRFCDPTKQSAFSMNRVEFSGATHDTQHSQRSKRSASPATITVHDSSNVFKHSMMCTKRVLGRGSQTAARKFQQKFKRHTVPRVWRSSTGWERFCRRCESRTYSLHRTRPSARSGGSTRVNLCATRKSSFQRYFVNELCSPVNYPKKRTTARQNNRQKGQQPKQSAVPDRCCRVSPGIRESCAQRSMLRWAARSSRYPQDNIWISQPTQISGSHLHRNGTKVSLEIRRLKIMKSKHSLFIYWYLFIFKKSKH